MKRKIIAVLLLFLLLFAGIPAAYGAEAPNSSLQILFEAGIVQGSNNKISSVDGGETVNRLTAIVLCLRLQGLEGEAHSFTGTDYPPDGDIESWALPLAAYVKANDSQLGYLKDGKLLPEEPVTGGEVIKWLLPLLGDEGSYTHTGAVGRAREIGIASAADKEIVTLNELSVILFEILSAEYKDSGLMLAEHLVEERILSRNMADRTGLVEKRDGNILTVAVAWKQTAAEYRALYHQGFNIATERVKTALAGHKPSDKPLAVVTDVDDTLLIPLSYWGYLITHGYDFFDDPIWDEWIPENLMEPSAGAVEFLSFCKANNVEVFYVTNRDQGAKTYEYALGNLNAFGFPYVDEEHVIVQIDTSDKEAPQQKIAEDYEIVVYLGDNLNDFKRIYYTVGVEERTALMEEDKDLFGDKFILFPNPTDGHWIRAVFGDSEPAPGNANRTTWEEAATRSSWDR